MNHSRIGLCSLAAAVYSVLLFGGSAFAQDGRATTHIFPQLADGRFSDGTYYRSALQISNPSTSASGTCSLAFRGIATTLESGDGTVITAGTATISLSGNTWGVYRTAGTSNFQSGYATLSCTIPVNAVVIYSYYTANRIKLSEAAVFSSPLGPNLQVISDQRDGSRLGLAIANDTDSAATATISAGNSRGQVLGTAAVRVAARSNYIKFVDEILPGLPPDHLGQVFVDSSGPQLAAIGLRFSGTGFTTIPSSLRQAAAVIPPAPVVPTITSMTASGGNAGATVAINVTGNNFVPGATTVSVSGTGIIVNSTVATSATSLSTVFSISSSATLGNRTVTITTAAGTSNGLTFAVAAPPSSSSKSQAQRLYGTWLFSYSIGGSKHSDTYRLNNLMEDPDTPGDWYILGTAGTGNPTIAQYSADLNKFLLLDIGNTIDQAYTFDFAGTDSVSGCYYLISPHGSTNLSSCYAMTGARTSSNAISADGILSNALSSSDSENVKRNDVLQRQAVTEEQQSMDQDVIRASGQLQRVQRGSR